MSAPTNPAAEPTGSAAFHTGDAVRITKGMHAGRLGTVLGVNRHSGTLQVELLVPELVAVPDGPHRVVTLPFAAREVELASGANVPATDGKHRRLAAPMRDDVDARSRAACADVMGGHYICPRHRPMAYTTFARHRAEVSGRAA